MKFLFFFPGNVFSVMFLGSVLSLFELSVYYTAPELEFLVALFLQLLPYFIFGLLWNKMYIPNRCFLNGSINKNVCYFSLLFGVLGFIIEFLYFNIPAFSSGRESEFGFPVFHVLFYASIIFSCLYASCFFYGKEKYIPLIIAAIISVLILSRQMFMVSMVIYLISHIYKIKYINFKFIIKLSLVVILVLLFFGFIGNFRQKLASDYVDDYIILIGGGNEMAQTIGAPLFWSWLYIASPMYNYFFNLEHGSICFSENLTCYSSYLSNVFVPDIISGRLFPDGLIKIKLVEEALNVGTAFSTSVYLFGYVGFFIKSLWQIIIFYLVNKLLCGKFKILFLIYFSSLSIFLIFDDLFIRGEFFIVFVFVLLLSFFSMLKLK